MMNVERYGAGVFTVSEVLNEQECISLISFAEQLGFKGAAMSDLKPEEELYRKNDRVFFTDANLAATLYQKVESILPAEIDGW